MQDDSVTLPMRNADSPVDALLRTVYRNSQISFGSVTDDLYRFSDWLPIHRRLPSAHAPIAYQSTQLAQHLGLSRLYICFSGYWPQRKAHLQSGTFKECEAATVYSRMQASDQTLVLASAGNTARAFAHMATAANVTTVIVIPEQNLDALWCISAPSPLVTLIAIRDGDYADAITAAKILASFPGYIAEGGALNVARRDGMGTCFLAGTEAIGQTPAHYFQSIGSGTGALAAWEAYHRFIRDGRWGKEFLKLHLSQNAPFLLLYDSWKARKRALTHADPAELRKQASQIIAPVLSNRSPPYSISGGLYDALSATEGEIYAVDNEQARAAGKLFEEQEGIDIHPAAAVTVGSLLAAIDRQTINRSDTILLNITGGGISLLQKEKTINHMHADFIIHRKDISEETLREIMEQQ